MRTHLASSIFVAVIANVPASLLAESNELGRGVAVTFERSSESGAPPRRDARASRLLALRVPDGEAPTPFLSPGRFRATFEGYLLVDFFDDYTFSAEGAGTLELEIDGESVLPRTSGDLAKIASKEVELEEGPRRFVVRYESPPEGDAWFRILWSSFDFGTEPVPPRFLRHDPSHELLANRTLVRRGRELVASRRCLACHRLSSKARVRAMPELGYTAPLLDGIVSRLHAGWIARWISSPRSMLSDATMPRVVHGAPADSGMDTAAKDIVAYLATRTVLAASSDPPVVLKRHSGDSDRGAERFAELGCVACHRLEAADDRDLHGRRSLAHVGAKWKREGLTRFLLDPHRFSRSSRMPDLGLSVPDAEDLASFLIGTTGGSPELGVLGGDSERGERFFAELGCRACHSEESTPPEAAPPLTAVLSGAMTAGCLSASNETRASAPDFGFNETDRAALRAFAADDVASLHRVAPVEFAERHIARMRCTSCHRRDGLSDAWSTLEDASGGEELVDEAGEPKLIQLRPTLTWAGEKLHPDWLATVVSTDVETRLIRPWLGSRMPKFTGPAGLLAEGLALGHGVSVTPPAGPAIDAELASVGDQLIQPTDGFACATCHDLGGVKAEGVFDAKGPDLRDLPARLRHEFYHRWMRDPLRIDPETKMPQFAPEGRSSLPEVLGGDAHRQFESIWHALRRRAAR